MVLLFCILGGALGASAKGERGVHMVSPDLTGRNKKMEMVHNVL